MVLNDITFKGTPEYSRLDDTPAKLKLRTRTLAGIHQNMARIEAVNSIFSIPSADLAKKKKTVEIIEKDEKDNMINPTAGFSSVDGSGNGFRQLKVSKPKYDSIEYFRETSEFLVGSNDKYGIISTDKSTKVRLIYDSIEKITDEEKTYYVVKQSNLYGLLDSDGNTIIYPEYEQVGIDVKNYLQNGVTNGYVLYNKIIPVKQNNKWAIFDIDGNKITDFIYDSLGSTSINNSTRTYGVLEVPEYNLLVVSQNNKYNLIKLDGSPIFSSYVLDSVYITISEGKNIYYITSGENTKELISFLEENNVEKPTEE